MVTEVISVERVTQTENDSHNAEKEELALLCAAADHQDANCNHACQIDKIKYCFKNCLHDFFMPYSTDIVQLVRLEFFS